MTQPPSPVSRALSPVRLVLLFVVAATPAVAHGGDLLEPYDLRTAWVWDPGVVIPLVLSAWLYWRGSRPLWCGKRSGRGIRPWEAICFWCGWATLFLGLCSPLHPLGEVLFSAHMIQHELIMVLAAPLLVLGRPLVPFLWALPPSWRRELGAWGKTGLVRTLWRTSTRPAVAWAIQGGVLWAWHVPVLFEATLASEWVHALQHVSFLVGSLLFWWALVRGREGVAGYGAGVLYLFTTVLHTGVLGALLTFSPRLWYPAYGGRAAAWGLTPMDDQILAGLVMWIPAGTVYMAAALVLLAAWLRESDAQALRWWAGPRLVTGGGKDS